MNPVGETMWKNAIIVLAIASCGNPVRAADAEDYLEQQKQRYEKRLEDAEKKLDAAEKQREKKILDALNKYITAVEKVKDHWTKKGNLDEVIACKNELEKYRKRVAEMKGPGSLAKGNDGN